MIGYLLPNFGIHFSGCIHKFEELVRRKTVFLGPTVNMRRSEIMRRTGRCCSSLSISKTARQSRRFLLGEHRAKQSGLLQAAAAGRWNMSTRQLQQAAGENSATKMVWSHQRSWSEYPFESVLLICQHCGLSP